MRSCMLLIYNKVLHIKLHFWSTFLFPISIVCWSNFPSLAYCTANPPTYVRTIRKHKFLFNKRFPERMLLNHDSNAVEQPHGVTVAPRRQYPDIAATWLEDLIPLRITEISGLGAKDLLCLPGESWDNIPNPAMVISFHIHANSSFIITLPSDDISRQWSKFKYRH